MTLVFEFFWDGFQRITLLCPRLDYWSKPWSYESSHSPLPESWERLFAPCKCSFIQGSACGREETSIGSDGKRRIKPCPLGKWHRCRFRILYINHITGESTLHCPCATCCPDWRGVPCVTLESLFGEVEPTHSEEATGNDPLIQTQDLTRVRKPCWRLGNLFDERTTGSPDLDDDPVIPAWDVGLDIFDNMSGFALARNHLDLEKRIPSPALTARARSAVTMPENPPARDSTCTNSNHMPRHHWTFNNILSFLTTLTNQRQRSWTFENLLSSLTTTTTTTPSSIPSLYSLLPSSYPCITTTTTTTTTSTPPSSMDNHGPRRCSEAVGGFIPSTLLVVVYECMDTYIYIKNFPPPPTEVFLQAWRTSVGCSGGDRGLGAEPGLSVTDAFFFSSIHFISFHEVLMYLYNIDGYDYTIALGFWFIWR